VVRHDAAVARRAAGFEKCAAIFECCPSDVALIWLAELDRSRGLGPLERIAAINTAANRRT
jgi:hypothetical protein